MMAALMAFVAIAAILSTVAFQEYAEILRRDNEAEMMFRAQEISRAIQRYRADHGGTAPLELDLLMEPGPKGNYYLRRLYTDPLVLDGKWGMLFVGPGNQIIDPNADDQAGATGPSNGLFNQGQRAGLAGQQQNAAGNALGAGAQSTGLPIAGVRTLSDDRPFRVHNGLADYGQWLFTYFDLEVQQTPGGQQQQNQNRRQNGLGTAGPRGRGNSPPSRGNPPSNKPTGSN